jgi:hypothetical protein
MMLLLIVELLAKQLKAAARITCRGLDEEGQAPLVAKVDS